MQQKKIFLGGIDSDTTDELISEGRDRYRLNVRALSSDNSTIGAIETMNGNTLVNFPPLQPLPAGLNKVIGSKEDLIRKKVYFFVWNGTFPTNLHTIWEYDIDSNSIKLVLKDINLAFREEHLITSVNFVEIDANNHLMYWTDGFNEPRKINIEKGLAYSVGNFIDGYQTPFDIKWIARVKPAPQRPVAAWNNTGLVVNNLYNKNYQFKIQYVYDDNEVSAFSPFSEYDYPTVTYVENNADDNYTQWDTIDVEFNTGSSIVKKIRIAAKETNETDFYQIAEINKADNGYLNNVSAQFEFTNNGVYVPIEINESIKLFDNVPLVSGTHDIIYGNRIADGNITEGFDLVSADLGLTLGWQNVNNSSPNPKQITNKSYLKSGGTYTYGIVYYDYANRSGTTNINNGDYSDVLPNGRFGTTIRIPFITEPTYYPTVLNIGLSSAPLVRWDIYNEAPSWATHYQIVRSRNTSMSKYIQFVGQAVYYKDGDGVIIDPLVLPPSSCAIDIGNIIGRYKTEYPSSRLVYDFTKGDRIRVIANPPYSTSPYSSPPPPIVNGATYAPTSTTYGSLPDVSLLSYTDYEIGGYDITNQAVFFKIPGGTPITPQQLFLPGCVFEIYTPAKSVSSENQLMYEIGELYSIGLDSLGKRIHFGSTGNQFNRISTSSGLLGLTIGLNGLTVGHGFIVGDKIKAAAINGTWNCYGTVTSVSATSINATIPVMTGVFSSALSLVTRSAFGDFKSGDSFRPYQNMPYLIYPLAANGLPPFSTTPLTVFRWYSHVENMDVNNFFSSKQWDYGRPNRVESSSKRINRKSTIYYSQKFIPETFINGLSSVFDTSFATYEDKYGQITKLYSENHNLIMFQELKIGNIPVQQVVYNDLQGGNTVGASETVLNQQAIYYAGEYGIGKNAESFAVYGQAKYGIDVRRGVAWRLSIDGLTPISDTGFMHNFFTDKCEKILRNNYPFGTVFCYGGFDIKFNEYILAIDEFPYGDDLFEPNETLAWNERENAWSTFYSYLPENIAGMGINIISFKAGRLYTHNTNSIQANFYGVQYYPEIWSVLNANPSNVKVFEAIGEETNDAWEVYNISSPNGQSSNLILSDFQEKENMQYAHVWKDQNTPNVTNPLFEGDPMRDRTFLCKFKRLDAMYNKIFALNLKYIISQLHNR